jgi:general L-amino acid transport system substrate-binding protein
MILPELISKEPLGPMVRRGDDEFFAIVKWVMFALIEAEEYGITQANVDQMKKPTAPTRSCSACWARQRGHRQAAGPGQGLGLPRAIKAVGNYGEIFERNVGPKTR